MKKTNAFVSFLLAMLLLAFAAGCLSWFFWQTRTSWPHFPSDMAAGKTSSAAQIAAVNSLEPEIVVRVDHDYAYRIGDIVPVVIYLKEKPGTAIDLHSIALEGDFEIVGEPTVFVHNTADGGRRVRIDIKLQSFTAVPKWTMKANLSYLIKAKNEDLTVSLPAFVAYTSNTWDGRELVQEGHLAKDYGFEPFAGVGLIFGGLFGTIYFFRLALRFRGEKCMPFEFKGLPNRFLLARRDFNIVWEQMQNGDRSADRYAELSLLVRRLYRIEAKTTLEASYFLLYSFNGPLQVVDILRACDQVIYRGEPLSEKAHDSIKEVFDKLVPAYRADQLAQLPPTEKVLRSAEISVRPARDVIERHEPYVGQD